MTKKLNPVVSISDLKLDSWSKGSAYAGSDAGIAEPLGLTKIGAAYSEVPPGKSGCPYHVHHAEDEMFFILEGEGEYRFGEDRYAVKAGDMLGAPVGGPEYAHQLFNTGSGPLKYLSISSKSEFEICEYPDTGKIGFYGNHAGGGKRFRHITREALGLDYDDGDEGAK